jgi:hypothetical protein
MSINSISPVIFLAEPGAVLVWGSDFIHAGGVPTSNTSSRLSLVAHYANISSGETKWLHEYQRAALDFYKRSLYATKNDTQLFL